MGKTPSRLMRPFSFGPLYDLLFEALPDHRSKQGVLDVKRVATEIGLTKEGVYKWLRENKISPEGADKLIALQAANDSPTEKPLTREDFLTFIFA